MILYRFKTFRTSYYFPSISKDREILYSLYSPFGRRKLAKWVWWAFKHVAPFRWMCRCKNPDAEFPYSKIIALCPKGSVISFNMGTPGEEQKISMIGLDADGRKFFAKYSFLPVARQLSENEIRVLKALRGTDISPILYDSHISEDSIFFKTSCIEGKNPHVKTLNNNIWKLLDMLCKHHLPTNQDFEGLQTCLSHGDFTPWNMIVENGKYRLIDWEMAEEFPVGYDLLTYITQLPLLLEPKKSLRIVIDENTQNLSRYFKALNITDWRPYITAFAQKKYLQKLARGQLTEAEKFKELIS